jgi:YidC/Oxa1 family membrane protein insertase
LPEIRNPNHQAPGSGSGGGGGDLRGTTIFAVLMLVVLLGYQYFFKPTQATAPVSQTQSQPVQPAAPIQASQMPPSAPGASASAPSVSAALETQTTIENEQYKIVFTNRGAQVKHWILKKYKDTAGKPLDMVQPQVAAEFGFPLSYFTYEPALTTQLNQALYQVTASGAQPSATGLAIAPETNALTFHYAANGLDVVKTIRFDSSYVIGVESQVTRNGAPVRALISWPGGLGDMEEFLPSSLTRSPVRSSALSTFAWYLDGKQNSLAAAKVSNNDTQNAPYAYAAIGDVYFTSAFLPDTPAGTTIVTLHNAIDLPGDLSNPNSDKKPAQVLGLAMGDVSGNTRLRLYAGPKAVDILASIHAMSADGRLDGPSLESLIQFGWLTVIAKPLYLALRFLVEHGVGNWGWAIIIVTAIFNFVMTPTRIMTMKTSLKTMRIQPKVDAIKKRYANLKMNDPKRAEMNTEIMALHQSEGINMVGGCLPLIIQMPLFIAYVSILQKAFELRQAHWFWLNDLSSPDPTHILPILIIVSMFLSQYITPAPGMDPDQRRMMAIMMPAIFGFMLWHYASGMALYWGTSNLINLGIQLVINQSSMGKEMHAIAAKRALKKTGGKPATIQGRR